MIAMVEGDAVPPACGRPPEGIFIQKKTSGARYAGPVIRLIWPILRPGFTSALP